MPFMRSCGKRFVQPERPPMTIWRIRIACWITKATSTHSFYLIIIIFSQQLWFHESASMLRYTYVASLVKNLLLTNEGKLVYFRIERSTMVERNLFFSWLTTEAKPDFFSGISFFSVR